MVQLADTRGLGPRGSNALEVQILFRPLKNAGVAQLVERNLAKVDVTGSNPASRSKIFNEEKINKGVLR